MIDNDEEVEIKIEYFESVEEDPLTDHVKKRILENSGRSILSNIIRDEAEQNENVSDDVSLDNDEIPVDYENNDPKDQEDTTKWYRLVDNGGKYVCQFCNLSYSTIQTLRYHVKIKHNDNYHEIKSHANRVRQRQVKCYICKKKFKNITELKLHSETHNLNTTKNICFVCYAIFEEPNDLLSHMTNKHEAINKKIHICSICGYNTAKVYHFKQHMNTHTNKYKIKCVHCSYSTNRLTNLKIHEQTHFKHRSYSCKYDGCDYRCNTSAALRSHRLIHNKLKHMLYCDKCSYSTIYIQNLDKHLDSHQRNKVRKRI